MEEKKTHIRLMRSGVGMDKLALIYLDLDLKIKSLTSSLKIATAIAISAMKTFRSSIMDSFVVNSAPTNPMLLSIKKPHRQNRQGPFHYKGLSIF